MPRVTARTLALALAVAFPAPLLGQTPAADVPETHTVKQGDTLWGISRQYFRDPLQWPRLYQMNTSVVEDPHWIYPGEVLRLRSDVAIQSVPTAETVPTQVAAAPADTTAPVPADTASRESAETVEPPATEVASAPEDTTHIFPQAGVMRSTEPILRADFVDAYRAVTRAEFFQAGFLTEGKSWPFGTVVGTIAPQQVDARGSGSAMLFAQVGIRPPAAGAYQIGDTLLVVTVERGISGGFGQIVTPSGLIRVTDVSRPELVGVVIAQYGAIDPGMGLLIAEKYDSRKGVRAQPLADGIEGTLIAFRATDVLRGPGDAVFIDKGRDAGMKVGDVLEVRRTTNPRAPGTTVVPEVVARLLVVHVGDKSATARVSWVGYPDIPVGTRWKLIARLPG
jgi:LysM repeat protein